MFRGLSINKDKPAGKQAAEQTIKNIATQYSLGRPEWQTSFESRTKIDYTVRLLIWKFDEFMYEFRKNNHLRSHRTVISHILIWELISMPYNLLSKTISSLLLKSKIKQNQKTFNSW